MAGWLSECLRPPESYTPLPLPPPVNQLPANLTTINCQLQLKHLLETDFKTSESFKRENAKRAAVRGPG